MNIPAEYTDYLAKKDKLDRPEQFDPHIMIALASLTSKIQRVAEQFTENRNAKGGVEM